MKINIEYIQQLGLMATPLLICSVMVIAIVLERLVFFLKTSLFSHKNTYHDLRSLLNTYEQQDKSIRDKFISIELNRLKMAYHKGVKPLKIIGTIAPLLGLLGTVLGIISAFKVIAAHDSHVSPNMIASGLWEAMLTTAVGLMIAIPALLFAHFFVAISTQRLQKLGNKLEQDSLQIVINQENHDNT